MASFEDDVSRYLRDADKREREADRRHKELLDEIRRSNDLITRAIGDGFKLVHDAILDSRR